MSKPAKRKPAAKPLPRNVAKTQTAPGTPPGGVRVDDATFFRRLEFVDGLLREGRVRADIVAACEREFGMAPRTCDDYIARSRVRWEQERTLAAKDQRQATLERIEALLSKLERERAWAPLISALRLQVDVLGLNAPHRLIVEEATKVDPLEGVGMVKVIEAHIAGTRAMTRALHLALAAPCDEAERVALLGALRELRDTIENATRELRTHKA